MNTNNVTHFMFRYNDFTRRLFFLFFSFILFLLPFFVEKTHAVPGLGSIETTLIPQNPGPRETVTVKVDSFSLNINSAEVTVFVDGKLLQKGIGVKTFEFTTKDIGQKSTLNISVKKPDGSKIEDTLSVIPAHVDLIYELKNPHRPFGYEGKSIAMSNSEVTVFAFPHIVDTKGQRVSKDKLVYTWYKNYTIDSQNSGFGKSQYYIKRLDAFPRETIIELRVATVDGKVTSKGTMTFQPQSSEVEFYLLEPGLPFSFKNIANPDIYSRYLDSEILAIPYFMDGIGSGESQYQWSINDKLYNHPQGQDKNKIVLVNGTGANSFVGEVKLSLQIKNSYRILQALQEDVSVLFTERSSGEESDFFYTEGKVEKSSGFFGF